MIKKITILFISLILSVTVFAQQKELVKITLKSGAVHYGELIVQTDEMIMIQEKDGSRYQFQTTDIEKKETASDSETTQESSAKTSTDLHENNSGVFALTEAGIYDFSAHNTFDHTTAGSLKLSLCKQLLSGNIFAGAGMGIITSIEKDTQISLLPVFVKCNYLLNKNRLSPFAGMEAGYSFSLNKYYEGGMFVSADLGLSIQYSARNFIKLSITTGVQQIRTNLTEATSSGAFSYYGNTNIISWGLKAGLQF